MNNEYKDIKLKTFIRWFGNKSKHLKHILSHLPENIDTYIEPFIGSGAVFLSIKPNKWIINDLNKDLINVWENIKNNPNTIIQLYDIFEKDFKKLSKNDKLLYCREITENIDKLEYNTMRASLYLLMKQCVYMGHIFIKNKFYFNSLDLNILSDKFFNFKNIYENFNNVSNFLNTGSGKILNKDYKEVLKKTKKGDFVFLDPPYIEDYDYKFNYNKNENNKLNDIFLWELYNQVKKLDEKGVKWLMTQAETKEIKNIFKEYTITKFPVYRACNKSYINELIIKNY